MSQSRWNLVYLILFLSVAAVFVAFYALDLRLNLTPSLPMGIWYQAEWASTSSRRGDVVVFCPPDTLLFRKAKANGVLRWGRCVGGYAPLMKRVVAVAGDVVEVDDVVKVNGREIAPSRVIPEVAAVYGRGARKRKLA